MKSNLTTGEVDFSLYLDFRPMINKVPFYNVPTSGGSVVTAINLPNGGGSALLTPSDAGIVLSQTTLTSSSNVTITTPAASARTVFSVTVSYVNTNGVKSEEIIYIVVQ